jgi:uncharacterized protein with HEPN domain
MRHAARQAMAYVFGMDQVAFEQDSKTLDAVIMKLLVIGELASKILEEDAPFTTGSPDVPWLKMKGMRNRMAHGYFELDHAVVWDTVKNAVPELIEALDKL